VRLSHSPGLTRASFDDRNLVSHGGLVPVMALAERAGLPELLAEHARPGTAPQPRSRGPRTSRTTVSGRKITPAKAPADENGYTKSAGGSRLRGPKGLGAVDRPNPVANRTQSLASLAHGVSFLRHQMHSAGIRAVPSRI